MWFLHWYWLELDYAFLLCRVVVQGLSTSCCCSGCRQSCFVCSSALEREISVVGKLFSPNIPEPLPHFLGPSWFNGFPGLLVMSWQLGKRRCLKDTWRRHKGLVNELSSWFPWDAVDFYIELYVQFMKGGGVVLARVVS